MRCGILVLARVTPNNLETNSVISSSELNTIHAQLAAGINNVDNTQLAANAVTNDSIADGAVTPVKWTNPFCFSARNSDSTTTATQAKVENYGTEEYDPNDNFDPVTGDYTVPVNGYYLFGVVVQGVNVDPNRRVMAWLDRNGAVIEEGLTATSNSANHDISVSFTAAIECFAGDVLHVENFHDQGSNLTVRTRFHGMLINRTT